MELIAALPVKNEHSPLGLGKLALEITTSRYEMEQNKLASAALIIVSILFLATISACAGLEPGSEELSAPPAEEIASAEEIDTAEVNAVTGLDIIMDGSSLEAYEKSLEKVRKTGSEADYESLKRAFKYLLFYDVGAQNNPETLAARLDGKTGHEIIAKVRRRTR